MEAKELMIGDWVYDEYQKPCRVKGWYMHSNTAKLLHPIPLTEDILKANGFVFTSINAIYKDNEHQFVIGLYGKNNDILDWNYIKLLYVHQLQHALRLCGLGELADNFKIEAS